MKIALLGQFGSGNTGNDGSLRAMVEYLRDRVPDAELLCICSQPSVVSRDLNLPSVSISSAPPRSAPVSRVRAGISKVRRVSGNLRYAFTTVGEVDLVIVPGTGILDDFKESPFGWPYCLLRWCLMARARKIPVAFVSVGAGPIRRWLSRRFLTGAAKCATYISYRDTQSRDYMAAQGCRRNDGVFPDIAFRLKTPDMSPRSRGEKFCVGVGVMDYSGWTKTDPANAAIAAAYSSRMETLVRSLLSRGMQVRLLTGGEEDRAVVERILTSGRSGVLPVGPEDLCASRIDSLPALMRELALTDVVVASRYHNIVCGLAMKKPTISLSYAAKNEAVMRDFGRADFCHPIDGFDVAVVLDQVEAIRAAPEAATELASAALGTYRDRLSVQDGKIADRFL